MCVFEHQLLGVAVRLHRIARPFPRGDMAEVLVVALSFTVFGLVLGPEVCTAALFAGKRVLTHRHAKLEEVVQTTSVPTLDFLPSGKLPSSSMGILNSGAMKAFIEDAKSRYDFVFFDSPPIMGVSDAAILASEVDLAILVVQYRKYPQQMTLRAKQMVEKVGGRMMGVVLNNINISQDSYYYYYSGYYYDYYSKGDEYAQSGEKGSKEGSSKAGAEMKKKY